VTLPGVHAAVLTPLTASLEPDAEKATAYYRDLLDQGCDGVAILGTTGEAMSFDVEQRLRFMEAIARSGLPRERITCGTGAASLAGAVRLTRAAFDLGFAAALVMPPFFYRDAGDEGILAFFDTLLARSNPRSGGILLYNFPRMSGITLRAPLVRRLVDAFAGIVCGMKESSNDRALQREVIERNEGFAVFPGSEAYLAQARAYGAAGCISGSVSLWPALAQEVFRTGDPAKEAALAQRRERLSGVAFIPAVRRLTAVARDDASWERAMPPLTPLSPTSVL
jgi:4-hydroxy-tetrahydrodipicolinate synthase